MPARVENPPNGIQTDAFRPDSLGREGGGTAPPPQGRGSALWVAPGGHVRRGQSTGARNAPRGSSYAASSSATSDSTASSRRLRLIANAATEPRATTIAPIQTAGIIPSLNVVGEA